MNLLDYVLHLGGTAKPDCPILARVAVAAGCAPSTLFMISRGHKKPGARLANQIELATNGDVSRHVLRPDYFGAGPVVRAA